jgi:hypothetical protein
MTQRQPNANTSLSSVITASIAPVEFIAASSASASPLAYMQVRCESPKTVIENEKNTYHEPLDVERIQDSLGRLRHPVVFCGGHTFSSFECWSVRSIVGEDELNREAFQSCSPKKKGAQGGILATPCMSSATHDLLALLEPYTDEVEQSEHLVYTKYIVHSPDINPDDEGTKRRTSSISPFKGKRCE